MIRFICLNAFIAINTIIFCLLGLMFSPFDRNGRVMHFNIAVPWAKANLWFCGINVRALGQQNIDAHKNYIYMTNHQSYFDIFALLAYLPVDFKFILKQELMRIPLFGFAMKRAGYIGIQRKDPRKAVESMKTAVKRIKNGASVVIFPEGTRSLDGRLQPFKKGGFNLALRSGCDIVPVTINNSYRIVPKGSLRINKGFFSIHIGKPISIKDYNRKDVTQLMEMVRNAMLRHMHEGSIDPKSGSEDKE